MSRLNRRAQAPKVHTHEGARAYPHLNDVQRLRRAVFACFLWEKQFYEDGVEIATRISELAKVVAPETLAEIAVEARSEHNLRHVPLLLLRELVRTGAGPDHPGLVAQTIYRTIQRADELAELLALYWATNDGKKTMSAQLKKGLAAAYTKFDAYQLGKYNRPNDVKLRDVLFLSHAKPLSEEQAGLWGQLVEGTLESPDTWEVNLSGGGDKGETFTRLIQERKLGYFALLRNLRNMVQANVDAGLIRDAILARKGGAHRLLPFRYIAAARAVPQFEPELDQALQAHVQEAPAFDGNTIVLVDVSGSMSQKLSQRSDLTRFDAAAALASMVHGTRRVFTFSSRLVEVPPRYGMAGVDAIGKSQPRSMTYLGRALQEVMRFPHDRLIVITDEQSHDRVPDPVVPRSYMINVASYRNGVGYGKWTHLDGFSEAIFKYLHAYESL